MNTRDYLIAVLRAYLNNEKIALDDSIDYFKLFEIARNNNLSAIVFSVIKQSSNRNIVPKDAYSVMEDSFFDSVFRYEAQKQAITDLSTILSDAKVKHIFFKGAEIKEYYPIPEVRAMGDIDVLIHQENRDKVKDLLISKGYNAVNTNGPVYDYDINGVRIEMHTKIISGKVGNADAENGFLDAINNAKFDEFCGILESSYHYAYLLTHIAHHFWFYGAGAKLILDLAVMHKHYDIDIDAVIAKMDSIGLGDFSKIIMTICYKWFGVGFDFNVDTASTEDFILSYGAFGNANRNRAAVIQRKELEGGKKNSPFLTRLRLLFPSYQKMKNIPYISFIEGRPYLTPIAWIYRIFYNLKHRRDFVKNATSAIGDEKTNELAQNELKYFEEIGLL